MQRRDPPPKVSVGLPVYNGERYLVEAIESILAQTYANFELIVSDNASTDRTEEIVRHYAALDPRIRYFRQAVNLGAAPNFNRVFELAEGSKYFKWAAHDDWIAPTFLEECVGQLEQNPDAVLCQSLAEIVDVDGRCLYTYDHTAGGTSLARSSDRFRARLNGEYHCVEVFGVIRSSALASSSLIGSHVSADRALLLELALCGRFALVPRRLFFNRNHNERFSRRGYTSLEKVAWYTTQARGQNACQTWVYYAECLRIVGRRATSRAERLRCYAHLLRSLGARRRWLVLMLEPVVMRHAPLYDAARKLRRMTRGRLSPSTGRMGQAK